MTEPRPCPRCGGKPDLIHKVAWDPSDPPEDDAEWDLVRCPSCYLRTGACDTSEEAIERWNGGRYVQSLVPTAGALSPSGSTGPGIEGVDE